MPTKKQAQDQANMTLSQIKNKILQHNTTIQTHFEIIYRNSSNP